MYFAYKHSNSLKRMCTLVQTIRVRMHVTDLSSPPCIMQRLITSTQVAADWGALRIWRRVLLPEGGQKFCLQWQLADTAWLSCARVAATRSGAEQLSNTPTQSRSLQQSHPHLNSIFASKLHARAPLHWVICIRLIRWHGAHLQAVVIVMEILWPDPEKLPSSLWSRNPKLMSGLWLHMHLIYIFTFLAFLLECPILFKKKPKKQSKTWKGIK